MTTASLVPLVRQVLASPTAEPAMQRQVLKLAAENLHQDGMAAALVGSLVAIRDSDLRRSVLALISSLDTGRFTDLSGLHTALLDALAHEEERAARATLISRLAAGIGQDARIAPALIALLARPDLPDDEAAAVIGAVGLLAAPDEATVLAALAAVRSRELELQEWAVSIATTQPALSDAVVTALLPYLEPRIPAALRLLVLRRLVAARRAPAAALPALGLLLRQDPDAEVRQAALEIVATMPDAAGLISEAAARDAAPEIRARASRLLADSAAAVPDPATLAQRLADPSPGVRASVLAQLRPHLRQTPVRSAVVAAFAAAPALFDDGELDLFLELLTPYATREAGVRDAILAACAALPRPSQRERLIAALIPKVRIADVADRLAGLFGGESHEGLRAALFAHLRPLALARHPGLVTAYARELAEPGSPFRADCATALAAVAEDFPAAQAALADVLEHDTDRALVRTCLDGYLKPRVARVAGPLLCVIEGQELDTTTRQRALEAVVKLPLEAADQERLAGILAGPGSAALKRPAP